MSTCVKIKTFSQCVKYDEGKQQEFGMLRDHLLFQGKLKTGPKEKVRGEELKRKKIVKERWIPICVIQDYFKPHLEYPLKYENFTPTQMFQASVFEVHCEK